ncbi:MAG: EF-P lysine aminoacylase EpmA [Kiritimatiellia bacterium]
MDPVPEAGERGRLAAKRSGLECRARLLTAIRSFFITRDFLEVETPVRVSTPALELHIDAESSGAAWLRTSPELHMKRLLAAGYPRLFQIGPCFRAGERGRFHHPEYTMLEWYRAGADNTAILADMRDLLRQAAREVLGGSRLPAVSGPVDVGAAWAVLTVSEAFRTFAGWDPAEAYDADRFDLDLMQKVEPALPRDRPCVLTEYPAAAAALARLKPGDARVAERWELYAGGVELANAYTELTDPDEQESRFHECAEARRRLGKTLYPLDRAFLGALRSGMPPCAGVALGVDRLAMLFAGAESLDGVMAFREPSEPAD